MTIEGWQKRTAKKKDVICQVKWECHSEHCWLTTKEKEKKNYFTFHFWRLEKLWRFAAFYLLHHPIYRPEIRMVVVITLSPSHYHHHQCTSTFIASADVVLLFSSNSFAFYHTHRHFKTCWLLASDKLTDRLTEICRLWSQERDKQTNTGSIFISHFLCCIDNKGMAMLMFCCCFCYWL